MSYYTRKKAQTFIHYKNAGAYRMRPYGVKTIDCPDTMDCREMAAKTSVGGKEYYRNKKDKRQTRRTWKKKARQKAKIEMRNLVEQACLEWEDVEAEAWDYHYSSFEEEEDLFEAIDDDYKIKTFNLFKEQIK